MPYPDRKIAFLAAQEAACEAGAGAARTGAAASRGHCTAIVVCGFLFPAGRRQRLGRASAAAGA